MHVTYQRLWCVVHYPYKDVKKTILGHIHRLWPFTTCSWVTSTLHTLRHGPSTNSTYLWHLTKIFTFQTSSLECQVYLASITHQNMRKSKLLSWILNVEYILHNDRSNTIGPNRQYTRAYFKKLNTNQFFDLHNPLQTPSMRWNRLLRLPCGVGKMGCVRRHIWAWGGSFSMKKTGISSEALHITRSGARVLLSVLAVNVPNPLFLVYTKPCLPSLSAWIEWVSLIIFCVRFCPCVRFFPRLAFYPIHPSNDRTEP